MKTLKALIILFLLSTMSAFSQGIYVRGGLGAAICTSPHLWYQYTYSGTGSSSTSATEAKKSGLGDGLPFVVAAGYELSENFAIELGVDYFMSFTYKRTNSGNTYSNTTKLNGSMLSLVPAFVIRIPMDNVSPYARLGVKIGVLNSAKYKEVGTSTAGEVKSPSGNFNTTYKDYGGIAIGAQAALGADFKLSDMLSIFGEINVDAISWAPKKGKYTKYTQDGVDRLGNMTTKEKTWVYEKKTDNTTIPDSDPDKDTRINYSFTNTGLVLGVKIKFGK